MNKRVNIRYGKGVLNIDIPEDNFLFEIKPNDIPPIEKEEEFLRKCLREPLFSSPLSQQVRPGMEIVILVDDLTRPTPQNRILPILLTSLLEIHSDVRFDLFHGNWPYAGEILFLGKNYPNVHIDACWLNVIDAWYAKRLFANSITAVPHTKIHGFGVDYGDVPEYAVCHLLVTKDAIAAGLAEVVDIGWLREKEAIKIAADWLFNNPNEWYKLSFDPVEM